MIIFSYLNKVSYAKSTVYVSRAAETIKIRRIKKC